MVLFFITLKNTEYWCSLLYVIGPRRVNSILKKTIIGYLFSFPIQIYYVLVCINWNYFLKLPDQNLYFCSTSQTLVFFNVCQLLGVFPCDLMPWPGFEPVSVKELHLLKGPWRAAQLTELLWPWLLTNTHLIHYI